MQDLKKGLFMRVGIHQPNFTPWMPFFYKMAMCDVFVLLSDVQFEKGGYQNRYKKDGKWLTKPVKSGLCDIKDKQYLDGSSLFDLNRKIIESIATILNIKTKIIDDDMRIISSDPTDRLISIIKYVQNSDRSCRTKKFDKRPVTYITNPDAKDKYLDETLMRESGIDIEYCNVPKNIKRHVFEMFDDFGIEGTINQLPNHQVDTGHPDATIFNNNFYKLSASACEFGVLSKEYKNAVKSL